MSLENNGSSIEWADVEEMVVKPFWFPVPDGLLFTPETINENASVMDETQTDAVDEKIRVEDNVPQRRVFFQNHGILRISNKLFLRIRYWDDTKTFDFILERNCYGKITEAIIITFEQYVELIIQAEYIFECIRKQENNVKIQLPMNLSLLLCKKFIIFKQFDIKKNHLIKNFALNIDQFEKLCIYFNIVLTLCPQLKS